MCKEPVYGYHIPVASLVNKEGFRHKISLGYEGALRPFLVYGRAVGFGDGALALGRLGRRRVGGTCWRLVASLGLVLVAMEREGDSRLGYA